MLNNKIKILISAVILITSVTMIPLLHSTDVRMEPTNKKIPTTQHIDGYQANRNLILGRDARSDSIPGLEILNNDVRCTHGSTVGKIDQEQLFYLLSRGIPRDEAEMLIIQGFFHDIFSRFVVPEVKDRLWQSIEEKLNRQ